MAMTLRLDDARTEALRRRSEQEGRSMQALVQAAIDEYLERHGMDDLVNRSVDRVVARYSEVLDRLAQ